MKKRDVIYFVCDGPDEEHIFWNAAPFPRLMEALLYVEDLEVGRWYRIERHNYTKTKRFEITTPDSVTTIEGPKQKA